MATKKYGGEAALARIAELTKSLVNAVKGTAESAAKTAQTASAEAKWLGTSNSIASATSKLVTLSGFTLASGAKVAVTFKYANTAETATLNVNSTGAIDIKCYGASSLDGMWEAGETCMFIYDGTGSNWVLQKTPAGSSIELPLSVANGGTGATDAATARTNLGITLANLGAAAASHTHALTDCTGTLTVAKGGTGATTAADARTNLGITLANLGAAAASHTHAASDVTSGYFGVARGGTGRETLTSNAVLLGNGTSAVQMKATASGAFYATAANGAPTFGTLPIAQGGTGKTTAADARTALGITPANIGAAASSHSHALTDCTGTLTIAKGGTGATTAAAALSALGGAKMALYTASIATTGWSANSSGGYTKTQSISGILATDTPVAGVQYSNDVAAAVLQGKAFACVNRITTAANSITMYAFADAPTTAFTLQLLCVRSA